MVLIVDDNSFNIVAIQSLIEQFNLQSDYCNDGLEAIKLVQARANDPNQPMYKLILMDYSMPECDGPTATAAIRNYLNEVGQGKYQPIICILTAYSERTYLDKANEAGSSCYYVKPIFKPELHKLLIKAGLIE